MIWPKAHLNEVYLNIKDSSVNSGCSVIIYVGLDCDAICACRILTALFKSDQISYKMKPVGSLEDIKEHYKVVQEYNEFRSIVMINCGGHHDVEGDLFSLDQSIFCYIVDSRRPFHHRNVLNSSPQTIILEDEFMASEEIKMDAEDIKELSFSDLFNNDEEIMDDDIDEDNEIDEEAELEDSKENIPSSNKRKSPDFSASKPLKRFSPKELLSKYYSGTSFGVPAAHTMYKLAEQLNKDTKELLWLAIVATTSHYLLNHLEYDTYHSLVLSFQEYVKNRTDFANRTFQSEDGATVAQAKEKHIEISDEMRLFLQRHLSLKQAFCLSEYTVAKLGLYRTGGIDRLHTLFAKMGISRTEADQIFAFSSNGVKAKFNDEQDGIHKFIVDEEEEEDFELGKDFMYESFRFRSGYDSQMSAADTVACVTAFLHGFSLLNSKFVAVLDKDDKEEEKARQEIYERENILESFNAAYDLLDFRSDSSKSLDLATQIEQAIIGQGTSIMIGQKIKSAIGFRYCILEGAQGVFHQPLILERLAQFVILAHTSVRKWMDAAAKPLLLGVRDEHRNLTVFVGVPCSEIGKVKVNVFGHIMEEAAKRVGTTYSAPSFECASLQIRSDDSQNFLLALYEVLNN